MKNHDYPDTLYVSDLIAPDTVNTLPEKTLKAYADHGSPGTPIQKTYHEAAQVMKAWPTPASTSTTSSKGTVALRRRASSPCPAA